MLNNDWVITQVERERINFPTETMRAICSEITYFYKKNGMKQIKTEMDGKVLRMYGTI